MARIAHTLAIPLAVLGGLLYVAGLITGEDAVYGAALLVFGLGVLGFTTYPGNPRARSIRAAHAGELIAATGAFVDSGYSFAGGGPGVQAVATGVIVLGAAISLFARTTPGFGRD